MKHLVPSPGDTYDHTLLAKKTVCPLLVKSGTRQRPAGDAVKMFNEHIVYKQQEAELLSVCACALFI